MILMMLGICIFPAGFEGAARRSGKKGSTHYAGVDERILELGIALEQLVPEERGVPEVRV